MKKIRLFFECFLNWSTTESVSREDWKKVDAIFCQSFGPLKNEPGISNKFLAISFCLALTCFIPEVFSHTRMSLKGEF